MIVIHLPKVQRMNEWMYGCSIIGCIHDHNADHDHKQELMKLSNWMTFQFLGTQRKTQRQAPQSIAKVKIAPKLLWGDEKIHWPNDYTFWGVVVIILQLVYYKQSGSLGFSKWKFDYIKTNYFQWTDETLNEDDDDDDLLMKMTRPIMMESWHMKSSLWRWFSRLWRTNKLQIVCSGLGPSSCCLGLNWNYVLSHCVIKSFEIKQANRRTILLSHRFHKRNSWNIVNIIE